MGIILANFADLHSKWESIVEANMARSNDLTSWELKLYNSWLQLVCHPHVYPTRLEGCRPCGCQLILHDLCREYPRSPLGHSCLGPAIWPIPPCHHAPIHPWPPTILGPCKQSRSGKNGLNVALAIISSYTGESRLPPLETSPDYAPPCHTACREHLFVLWHLGIFGGKIHPKCAKGRSIQSLNSFTCQCSTGLLYWFPPSRWTLKCSFHFILTVFIRFRIWMDWLAKRYARPGGQTGWNCLWIRFGSQFQCHRAPHEQYVYQGRSGEYQSREIFWKVANLKTAKKKQK